MVNIGQAAVGLVLLLIVVGGLLYIFKSRTNAVEKTGYGSLIMLMLVSLMIPLFWILEGNNQVAAQVQQHNLALERGMLLYIQYCTDKCYGIKDDKVVNATYNGYTIADLNKMNDDDLRRIISAGIYNPKATRQPANPNAIPRSDRYGGALLSNDVEYLFQFIRSDDPAYLKKHNLPAGSGFDKLPEYLKNNNPTAYQAAVALGNPVNLNFGQPVDKTKEQAITINIVKASPSIQGCTSQIACYEPVNVKVKVGTTITWVNQDAAPHTVTAIKGTDPNVKTVASQIFDSGLTPGMKTGDKFTYKVTAEAYNFNPDHTVLYYCQFHPDMVAVLTIVQ
ncbi:MAG: hypothetical protein IMW89_06525 [Ktedonobacteraceae bacterium]|nr:hypothetical protein [Ktedonobacteraceae bacterium]